MRDDLERYDDLERSAYSYANGDEETEMDFTSSDDSYDDFDETLRDIDFSEFRGKSFKQSFSKTNRKIQSKSKFKKVIVPDNRKVIVESRERPMSFKPSSTMKPRNMSRAQPMSRPAPSKRPSHLSNEIPIRTKGKHTIQGDSRKKISTVIVPDNKKVIVQGVSKFILSQNSKDTAIKEIGYYKGKKLKELVLTFNNNSALPFELELFNPSMPLDYLYSTSLNLNDKISVAGGGVSYTDVLYNMLANSTMIPNCKFVFAGSDIAAQKSIALKVRNKSIEGVEKVHPLNLNLKIDTMQVAQDIVFFNIMRTLNRAFIPDGMDVIGYTILPGMTVTMAFFYEQVSLKKVFFNEAKQSKGLM
jgi:hypothetical protein